MKKWNLNLILRKYWQTWIETLKKKKGLCLYSLFLNVMKDKTLENVPDQRLVYNILWNGSKRKKYKMHKWEWGLKMIDKCNQTDNWGIWVKEVSCLCAIFQCFSETNYYKVKVTKKLWKWSWCIFVNTINNFLSTISKFCFFSTSAGWF